MGKLVVMARTPPPPKIFNLEQRSREHLFPTEVTAMISAAKKFGRHKLRDSTLILIAYRHGLRISELVALRWEQSDFTGGTIYINRLKHTARFVWEASHTKAAWCKFNSSSAWY
jgi:integrase